MICVVITYHQPHIPTLNVSSTNSCPVKPRSLLHLLLIHIHNQGGGCHGCHEGRQEVEREVVDKVTKMAAEFIFSVDAHISLTHSGGKPYECDQCKYSSKTAQISKHTN